MSIFWDISEAEYHADREHLSSTALKDFDESIPLYHAKWIEGSFPMPEPTAAMDLGSLVNIRLLEPHKLETDVVIKPNRKKQSNADKEFWKEFEKEHEGKLIVSAEQSATSVAMVESVWQTKTAARLLNKPGKTEQSIRWEFCQDTRIQCKCRFDRILDEQIILELKTTRTRTKEEFFKQAFNLKYYIQVGFYLWGATNIYPSPIHVFITITNEPPHECNCYALDAESIAFAGNRVNDLLNELKWCRENDFWNSRYSKGIEIGSLPRWAFTNNER